jgi:hypothetical protein
MFSDGAAPIPRGSRDIMQSLRGWLLILWLMLVVSAAVTGYLLIGSFRQSAAAQVGRAQELVARSCRDIADRYAFATAGWDGPPSSQIDEELRQQLIVVVAMPSPVRSEWKAASGSRKQAPWRMRFRPTRGPVQRPIYLKPSAARSNR